MTVLTKAALEEARRIRNDLSSLLRSEPTWEQFDDEIRTIATALTAAEERGRKAGEERIQKLRTGLVDACNELMPYATARQTLEMTLAGDDALAAKEKK